MDFHSVSRFFTKDNTYDIDRILKLHSSSLSVLEAWNERSRKSRKFLTIFSRSSIVHFSRNPSNLWYVTLVEVWFDDVYEMDPSFIDVHRGHDAVRCIVRRTMTFNRASQSMMNYSMRSRGGVAVVLFFLSFSRFPFSFCLFIHQSTVYRFWKRANGPVDC